MNWLDYVYIYLVVSVAVFTSLLFFRILDNYARYKRQKALLEELKETIESEIEFRRIVSKLNMEGEFE